MAAHPKYTESQRHRAAYVAACRARTPTDAQLAAELNTTPVRARMLMQRVVGEDAERAYQEGRQARREGRLFADNPYLEQRGCEVEMRFWVDGMVDSIIAERLA